eukprot:270684_1
MVYDFGRNGGGRFFLRTEPLSPPPPPTFFFSSATTSTAQARRTLPRKQEAFYPPAINTPSPRTPHPPSHGATSYRRVDGDTQHPHARREPPRCPSSRSCTSKGGGTGKLGLRLPPDTIYARTEGGTSRRPYDELVRLGLNFSRVENVGREKRRGEGGDQFRFGLDDTTTKTKTGERRGAGTSKGESPQQQQLQQRRAPTTGVGTIGSASRTQCRARV